MKRYPGIRPFTTEDQHLFKGREKESRELFQLVVLNDIVILFGKSGIGKTSLLQAGVCPELEDRSLHPVFIRLNQTHLKPEEQVFQQLKDGNYLPKETPADLSLWEYFKLFWYVDLGEVFKPVIIFDQFEELFTLYHPEERIDFIRQLADVVNGRFPDSLKGKIIEEGMETAPEVKFIIGIRSDYLYLLDELSSDRENATEAITLPASEKGQFNSSPFSFSKTAIDNIIDTLGKEESDQLRTERKSSEPEIEAFQLQLFCGYIEDKIIQEKRAENFQVTPDYYGGDEGIQEIIGQFYANVLRKVREEEQDTVEKILAKGLIRNGRRIIMEETVIIEEYKITKELLDLLHQERLLNKEARKGNFYYEISHDTLVEPILDKYQTIEKREEIARQKADKIAKEKELAVERQKRRQIRRVAIAGFVLAAISIIALFMVWQANIEVSRQVFNTKIQMATTKKVEGKYEEAFLHLKEAAPFAKKLEGTDRERLKDLNRQWRQVDSLVTLGNQFYSTEAYNKAIPLFEAANEISPDQSIQKLERDARDKLKTRFNEFVKKAEDFERAKVWENVVRFYEKALELEPNDSLIIERLNKVNVQLDGQN